MTDQPFIPLKALTGDTHQSVTLGATALTLSVPLQARGILMQATAQNIRYTLDGTTPTASTGFQMIASDPPLFVELTQNNNLVLKFIRETSGAVLEYEYSE